MDDQSRERLATGLNCGEMLVFLAVLAGVPVLIALLIINFFWTMWLPLLPILVVGCWSVPILISFLPRLFSSDPGDRRFFPRWIAAVSVLAGFAFGLLLYRGIEGAVIPIKQPLDRLGRPAYSPAERRLQKRTLVARITGAGFGLLACGAIAVILISVEERRVFVTMPVPPPEPADPPPEPGI